MNWKSFDPGKPKLRDAVTPATSACKVLIEAVADAKLVCNVVID